jgi:beta-glucanase (GH16 family)
MRSAHSGPGATHAGCVRVVTSSQQCDRGVSALLSYTDLSRAPSRAASRRRRFVAILLAVSAFAAMAALGATSRRAPAVPVPIAPAAEPGWNLVFDDEFNGTGVDTSKWDIQNTAWFDGSQTCYNPSSVSVANGVLALAASRETITCGDGQVRPFKSGMLRSDGKFTFTYGRVEVRAKLPVTAGLWTAIWMLPQSNVYGGWPNSGELDINETIGQEPQTLNATIHYGGGTTKTGKWWVLPGGGLISDWHTYAVEWRPGDIRWFVDDVLFFETTWWPAPGGASPVAPFDQNFYILLDLAVGGSWPGLPTAPGPYLGEMDIDYVRVYQSTVRPDGLLAANRAVRTSR